MSLSKYVLLLVNSLKCHGYQKCMQTDQTVFAQRCLFGHKCTYSYTNITLCIFYVRLSAAAVTGNKLEWLAIKIETEVAYENLTYNNHFSLVMKYENYMQELVRHCISVHMKVTHGNYMQTCKLILIFFVIYLLTVILL